jgi:hypothetical protein
VKIKSTMQVDNKRTDPSLRLLQQFKANEGVVFRNDNKLLITY